MVWNVLKKCVKQNYAIVVLIIFFSCVLGTKNITFLLNYYIKIGNSIKYYTHTCVMYTLCTYDYTIIYL